MEIQVFDLVLVAIAVLSVVFAAKKGFAKSLLETASVFVAGFASYKFCDPVSQFVYKTFLSEMPYAVASVVARIVSFAVMFVVFSILLKLASGLLSSVLKKIPLVGTANKLMGGVLGLLKAIVIIYVICTVCYLTVISDSAENLKPIVSNSVIYQYITENNPVTDFIQI